ncbi:MAG: hypothetical protein Fur0018_11550 [Anaerolineales bacterium]
MLAARLADRLAVPFVELDALYWQANGQAAAPEDFRARVDAATHPEGWVLSGNYSVVRDIIWPRAQALIWLDYPFLVGLRRLLVRTLRRAVTREVLWNGNREPFWPHLKVWSDESLIGWYFRTWGRRRRETPEWLAEYPHLSVWHFHHPREMDAWFAHTFGDWNDS